MLEPIQTFGAFFVKVFIDVGPLALQFYSAWIGFKIIRLWAKAAETFFQQLFCGPKNVNFGATLLDQSFFLQILKDENVEDLIKNDLLEGNPPLDNDKSLKQLEDFFKSINADLHENNNSERRKKMAKILMERHAKLKNNNSENDIDP